MEVVKEVGLCTRKKKRRRERDTIAPMAQSKRTEKEMREAPAAWHTKKKEKRGTMRNVRDEENAKSVENAKGVCVSCESGSSRKQRHSRRERKAAASENNYNLQSQKRLVKI